MYVFFKPFAYAVGQSATFDSQTVIYPLDLGAVPSSITLTDINGSASTVTPAQIVKPLEAQNAPRYLEVVN